MDHLIYAGVTAFITLHLMQHVIGSIVWPEEYEDARDPRVRGAWKSGDLLLVANSKGNSLLINLASGAPWTHIGILVRVQDEWFLWHSDMPDTRFDATKPDSCHSGVQLTSLDFFLDTSECIATRIPAPPALNVPCDDDMREQIQRTCDEGQSCGFDYHIPRLTAVARSPSPQKTWMWPVEESRGAWFCSAFVAEVYRQWGWDMDGAKNPRAFHPKHFPACLKKQAGG